MQIPRYPTEPCLLITDAGLASLVLTAMASEQPAADNQQRTTLYPAWWTSQSDMDLRIPAIDRAVEMQADLLSLTVIRDHAGYPEEAPSRGQQSSLGVHQTRMLLDAATLAIELGIKRVLWPIQADETNETDDAAHRLDQIATAIDRALLTARLATLDAPDHGEVEVTIETPLIDLSNQQVSDLAADLNVPISSCWWIDTALPGAPEHHQRWIQQPIIASMLEHLPVSKKQTPSLNT
ncbi:MAG: hypothetical protein JKY43_10045 [Phycisphaerales bacterium]|nr:hypothetical protein [Phycisphaerales bacterium]